MDVVCELQASLFLPPKDEEDGRSSSTGTAVHGSGDGEQSPGSNARDEAKDDEQSSETAGKQLAPAEAAASDSISGLVGGYGSSDDSDSDDSDD